MTLIINEPYIKSFGDRSCLCSDIDVNGEKKTLFYEVDKNLEQYFVEDRADCFLLGLLHHCMHEGIDIKCKSPISFRLLYQITTYYIPVLAASMSDMSQIKIDAMPIFDKVKTEGKVCTGISGGVDSFFTVCKNLYSKIENLTITHLLFNNVSNEDYDYDRIRKLYEKDRIIKKEIANSLSLDFVGVFTNLYSFYRYPGIFNHYYAAQYISVVLSLGKLFQTYYFASSYPICDFTIDEKRINDGANFDLFSLKCFSTENLFIYSSGSETSRFEKTVYISNFPIVQKYLQACAIEQKKGGAKKKLSTFNCGECKKCMRTIVTLYSINKVEDFKNTFDLTLFNKNRNRYIGKYLAADTKYFSKEIKIELQKNKKMNIAIRLYCGCYQIRYFFAKSLFLRKIYYSITRKKSK